MNEWYFSYMSAAKGSIELIEYHTGNKYYHNTVKAIDFLEVPIDGRFSPFLS